MPPTTFTRRPTPRELEIILRPEPGTLAWGGTLFAAIALFVCVFLVVLLVVSFFDGPPPWGVPLAVAVGVIAGTGLFVIWLRGQRRAAAGRAANRAREAANDLQVTRYVILDAIAVDEFEDEGLHFYLLLDDGRTLFLSGQYLYQAVEEGFPWRSFEIVRVPGENWVLSMTMLGDALTPTHVRPPFTVAEWQADAVPLDGTVASLDWAGLKAQQIPTRDE